MFSKTLKLKWFEQLNLVFFIIMYSFYRCKLFLIRVYCQLTVKGTVNMNINPLTEVISAFLKCL